MIKIIITDDMPDKMTLKELIFRVEQGMWTPNEFTFDSNRFIFKQDEYGMYKDQDGDGIPEHICLDFSNLNEYISYTKEDDSN